MIPAGENRILMDIMHREDDSEGGASTGRLYLPGYDPEDVGESEVYVRQDRPGAPWTASSLPGGMPEQSARDPHELLAKVARLYGITGTAEVSDERENVRRKVSGKRTITASRKAAAPAPAAMPDPVSTELRERLAHFTPAEQEQLRTEAQELRTARGETPAGAWRAVLESAEQDRLSGTGRYARTTRPNTGPGAVPVGGTDADRRAARPRMEGETDRAYAIRTAPSRDAALRQLQGHQLAGLRAIAREEGVVTASGDTKTGLIERLMRALYDRHADSVAITNMVNRDRAPAPTVAPPRTNTPATSGPITPTMTGAQLIAARRKLQAEQQGGNRR
jgi:hypothetical protein